MKIAEATNKDLEVIAQMMVKLWPECDQAEETENNRQMLQSERDKLLLAKDDLGQSIGFIHLSLRFEYVEGTETSPVGYIEAIFVEEAFRQRGTGKALVLAGENWCRKQGCQQMGSDTEITNQISIDFHQKLDYEEQNRVVCFSKRL